MSLKQELSEEKLHCDQLAEQVNGHVGIISWSLADIAVGEKQHFT